MTQVVKKITVALVAVALGLVSVVSVFAAGAPATGPDQPSTPDGGRHSLDSGAGQWYSFDYLGDGSQILVRMGTDSDQLHFSVWTEEQLQAWARDGVVDPVGQGTVNSYLDDDLTWSGSFEQEGTYYVYVWSEDGGTAHYSLSVTGNAVSFTRSATSTEEPSEATTAEVAAVAADEPAAATETTGGTGPDTALAVAGKWTSLEPGQTVWYDFNYYGGDSQILIQMWTDSNDAGFGVWTPEQVSCWAKGEAVDPIGRGTYNQYVDGDLSWSGSFAQSGIYYIVVQNQGADLAHFALTLSE